jgi:hypothetical protein
LRLKSPCRGALEDLVADLHARVDLLSATSGTIAVLDTNILLQYEEPLKVPWRKVLGVRSVRLIVPQRVVEELEPRSTRDPSDWPSGRGHYCPGSRRSLGATGRPGQLPTRDD